MSDSSNNSSNPQMGGAVNASQATEAAANQAGVQDSQPDFANMTGEQAKAWVEAQKAASQKPTTPKAQPRAEDGKFASKTSTPDPVKEAAKEAIRKFKVKVDGAEVEVDENELVRGYSHQKAANKILQEGKLARKQAEEFVQMMRDPEKFFEVAGKLGHDSRLLAEKYLAKQLETELMDPRDRELAEAKAKLKHIEDLERKQQEAVEAQRNEALKQKFAKDYNDQFVAALEESGLPPTKPMIAEMAKYIGRSAKIGFKMSAAEAAALVKEDVLIAHQRLIGDADGEILMKLLGENVANKIRKYDVAKLKSPEQFLQTPKDQPDAPRERPTKGNKRMSAKEWREFNRKK